MDTTMQFSFISDEQIARMKTGLMSLAIGAVIGLASTNFNFCAG
jgi:hypothetical protein